jgi:hypothetical protein
MEVKLGGIRAGGRVSLIDDADRALVDAHGPWSLVVLSGRAYARNSRGLLLHRLLMGVPRSAVDHINSDALDNRRCNLRLATAAQNSANARKQNRKTSSIYKGVARSGRGWIAYIGATPKVYLGYFKHECAAALAYNEAAREKYGSFARLNDVPPERSTSAICGLHALTLAAHLFATTPFAKSCQETGPSLADVSQ